MRLFWASVAFFAALAACQNATKEEQLAAAVQLVLTMPQCAQQCLIASVAASGSSGDLDIASSCANKTATAGIEKCARAACTIREQLTSKNITETLCQRPVREGTKISIASIAGVSCATLAFILRMASKVSCTFVRGSRIDADLWWDDLTISIAMLLLFPLSTISNILNKLGIGRDVWTIPFDDLTKILKLYYIGEIFYLVALPTIKIAILCTYLRIFQQKLFRKLVYGAIALNVAYAITFAFITAFQCSPVNFAWYRWDGETPGYCRNINAQSWASAGLNIFLDFVVVGLPMPMLWKMNLNPRKKFLVMLMFGVGFFVTIVSCLRLQILIKFGDSENLTYDYKAAGTWTSIEINTAMCCACMPGIRNLIRRFLPRLMGATVGTNTRGTGLSGKTAISSSNNKGVEVFVRARDSEDGTFIPLESINTKDVTPATHTHDHGTVSPVDNHSSRNFSRPKSTGWVVEK